MVVERFSYDSRKYCLPDIVLEERWNDERGAFLMTKEDPKGRLKRASCVKLMIFSRRTLHGALLFSSML